MRTTLIAPLVAATAIAALPATARADRSDCPRKLERAYSKHYRQVAHRHGKRAPGRNLRRWGVSSDLSARRASGARKVQARG
jgi:hypothetical protein